MNELFFNENKFISNYFVFTPEILPNYIGHLFLCFFNLFLPAFLSEKLLILFYLIAFPLSFRWLIKLTNKENILISYFIFPFVYSLTFFFGFYNFSIGLILLFTTLSYWISLEEKNLNANHFFLLFILISLTYLSHIVILIVLIFIICFRQIYILLSSHEFYLKESWKKMFQFLLVSSPAIFLTAFYFFQRKGSTDMDKFSLDELNEMFYNVRPIVAFNKEIEDPFTRIIFYTFSILCILGLGIKFKYLFTNLKYKYSLNLINFFRNESIFSFWFIISLLLVILFYLLPDAYGNASFISYRLCYLFFLFFIVWLSTFKWNLWIIRATIIVLFFCYLKLNIYHSKEVKTLCSISQEINLISKDIEANSTVFPIDLSGHWFVGHYSNYLGVEKPLVILENYEAGTGYFPIQWNYLKLPILMAGKTNVSQMCELMNYSLNLKTEKKIDYIFVYGNNKNDSNKHLFEMVNALEPYYSLYKTSPFCKLYKRKIQFN